MQTWKKRVSWAARPALCPARRKIHGASGNHGQKQRDAEQADPRALPDGRPNPFGMPRPVILGHERVDVGRHAQRKADQHEMDHAGGHGRGHRFLGVPQEEHPIDEVHHGPGGRGDDQRDRHLQHVAPAARACPPAPALSDSKVGMGKGSGAKGNVSPELRQLKSPARAEYRSPILLVDDMVLDAVDLNPIAAT